MIKKIGFFFIFMNIIFSIYSAEPMTIVYFENFPPYSWKNERGQMEGIFIDIANEILTKDLGIPIKHEGYPWTRAQNLVKEGKADAFITVATITRKKYTEVSGEPFLVSPISIFINKYSPKFEEIKKIKVINDLKRFEVLDYLGNGWGDEKLKDINRTKAVNLNNAFLMLENGRGDLIATDGLVAKFVLSGMILKNNSILELPIVLDKVEMSLCISKTSKFKSIIPNFDKKISVFKKKGGIDKILEKYRN